MSQKEEIKYQIGNPNPTSERRSSLLLCSPSINQTRYDEWNLCLPLSFCRFSVSFAPPFCLLFGFLFISISILNRPPTEPTLVRPSKAFRAWHSRKKVCCLLVRSLSEKNIQMIHPRPLKCNIYRLTEMKRLLKDFVSVCSLCIIYHHRSMPQHL